MRHATVTLALALGTTGCSWIFTQPPPAQHAQMPYFDCSTSYAPPVLDTIWGGLNFVGATLALAGRDDEYENRPLTIGAGFAWTVVAAASAYYGYTRVAECNEAKTQLMLRLRPAGYPPAQWGPPPGYPHPPAGAPPPYAPPPGTPPAPPAAPPSAPPATTAPPAAPPSSAPTAPPPPQP